MSYSKLHIPSMTPLPGYDGQIDELAPGAGLPAKVLGGQGYKAEDIVKVYLNDGRVTERVFMREITVGEEQNGIEFEIENRYVAPGDATLTYDIINSENGNVGESLELQLKVIPASKKNRK